MAGWKFVGFVLLGLFCAAFFGAVAFVLFSVVTSLLPPPPPDRPVDFDGIFLGIFALVAVAAYWLAWRLVYRQRKTA